MDLEKLLQNDIIIFNYHVQKKIYGRYSFATMIGVHFSILKVMATSIRDA
jgi:hypothetical protein